MFIHRLDERQQGVLLHYAREMMSVDSHVDAEELAHMETLQAQANPGVEPIDVPMSELASIFGNRESRVIFLLEIVGMGFIDDSFDPNESNMVQDIGNSLGITDDDDLQDIRSWVARQMYLVREAEELMETH